MTYVNATFNDSLSLPLSDLDRVRNMEIDAILRLNYTDDIWYYSVIHLSTSESSTEAKNRVISSMILSVLIAMTLPQFLLHFEVRYFLPIKYLMPLLCFCFLSVPQATLEVTAKDVLLLHGTHQAAEM